MANPFGLKPPTDPGNPGFRIHNEIKDPMQEQTDENIQEHLNSGRFNSWQGEWYPGGPSGQGYQKGDVVRDGAWLMVCTCDQGCTDRPAPQPTGLPRWISGLDNAPAWVEDSQAANTLFTVNRFTTSVAGYITNFRMWLHENVTTQPDYQFRLVAVFNPLSESPEYYSITEDWYQSPGRDDFWLAGSSSQAFLYGPGTTMDLVLLAQDATGSTLVQPFYQFNITQADIPAIPGQLVWYAQEPDFLRISTTDDDSIDRSALLGALTSGDTITISGRPQLVVSTEEVPAQSYWRVETIGVSLSGVGEGRQQIDFLLNSTATVTNVEIINHYAANPDVIGFVQVDNYDPGSAVLDQNAYGVDVEIQDAVISECWEVMAYSPLSGEGTREEPATRSTAQYHADVLTWLINEVAVESMSAYTDLAAVGLAPVATIPIQQFVSSNTAEINVSADQIQCIAPGHAYLIRADVTARFSNQNHESTFQIFDVTNAVLVGLPYEIDGRRFAGSFHLEFLTPRLMAQNDYEVRIISGNTPINVSMNIQVLQQSKALPNPPLPDDPNDDLSGGKIDEAADRVQSGGADYQGPYPT